MPIKGSKSTHAKSRSPAPPLPGSLPGTPKTFQSPAYYAAAGGFVNKLPPSPYFPAQDTDLNSRMHSQGRRSGQSRRNTRLESTSQSSLEGEMSLGKHEESKSRNIFRKMSPKAGFPGIEPHLLPSLRDTIERMTRPSKSPSFAPQDTNNNQKGREPQYHTGNLSHKYQGPIGSGAHYPRSSSPPTHGLTVPEKELYAQKNSQRPALKSSIRPPTPKIFSARVESANPSSSPRTPSLRTMRSLLGRKDASPMREKPAVTKHNRDPNEYEDILYRYTPEPFEESFQHPPALRLQTNASQLDKEQSFKSHIPRRTKYAPNDGSYGSVEDSDLDARYEREMREKRRLTVANAEVCGSTSSDSESDHRFNQDGTNIRSQSKLDSRVHHAGFGLGITQNNQRLGDSSVHSPNLSRLRLISNGLPPEKTLRFSLPPSESAGSAYSSDNSQGFHQQDWTNAQRDPRPHSSTDNSHYRSQNLRGTPPLSQKKQSDAPRFNKEEFSSKNERKDRRRSSSYSPRHGAFSEDSDYVPVVPRPRSACQRYPSQSPPAERFPTHLSDLIKSRNSLSKAAMSRPADAVDPHRSPRPRKNFPEANSDRTGQQSRNSASRPEPPPDQYLIAIQERQAFGIPPSESDEIHRIADRNRRHRVSAGESEVSMVDDRIWSDEESDIMVREQRSFRSPRRRNPSPTLSQGRFSPSSFEGMPLQNDIDGGLDSNETPRQYPRRRLESISDPQLMPKTREGVIQEIFETEEELLRLLHICVRVFILPLRIRDSRSWVIGVPPNVARLLDWFDDIVHLHEQIYGALCSARDTQSPATERIAESLRCFVLKVEVYQPYVVRLEDVSQEISDHVQRQDSEFGQFIALQEHVSACEGWSLESLLMLPANRLSAYQVLFSRMLDLTPKTHQDYISTFSLVRTTNMVVRIMGEVKIREHEYKLVKLFASRMLGLPISSQLPTRERRLLHSGPAGLLSPGFLQSMDTKSVETASIEQQPTLSSKTAYDGSVLPSSAPTKSSWFSRLPLGKKRSRSKARATGHTKNPDDDTSSMLSVDPSSAAIPVQAFIFSDLILLAQSMSKSDSDEPKWMLLQEHGVFRPLSIANIIRNSADLAIVSLEALDVEADRLNDTADIRSMPFLNLDITLTLTATEDQEGVKLTPDENLQRWLMAIRQCSRTTLRKLTFPSHQDAVCHGSDEILDTHLAVSSLVGSGLPLPRSPSGQAPETWACDDLSFTGNEREERGWWSLRYQQVFREFQRQDALLSDDEDDLASISTNSIGLYK